MIKKGLLIIIAFAMLSCKKDGDGLSTAKKDYSFFLRQSTQTFQGKLDNVNFSWVYGWNQSQSMSGYENGNGICDPNDPVRTVLFGLTSESDLQTRFTIYSPKYNSESEAEFSKVFSLGKKKLGNFRTDFYLSINKGNKVYQSNSLNNADEIEILKTQEFTDDIGKKIRVWFSIDAKLSSCDCQKNNSLLTEGLMIAEFYGYKKDLQGL